MKDRTRHTRRSSLSRKAPLYRFLGTSANNFRVRGSVEWSCRVEFDPATDAGLVPVLVIFRKQKELA